MVASDAFRLNYASSEPCHSGAATATQIKLQQQQKFKMIARGGGRVLALVRHFENRLLAIIVSSMIKFKRGVRRQKGVAERPNPPPPAVLQLRSVTKATAIPL